MAAAIDDLDRAIELLEKANAKLEPELMGAADARRALKRYAHAEKSTDNIDPRCWGCHTSKTDRDRKAGKLRPPPDP